MSPNWKDDSIATKLKGTKWEYSQSDDRRFLLDPIGKIFSTFCWNGKPESLTPRKRTDIGEDTKG